MENTYDFGNDPNNPDKIVKWILIGIAVLWAMLLITSCTTEKKAVGYMNSHAFTAAQYCANAFPVRDSVIYKHSIKTDTLTVQGEPATIYDTILQNGKEIIVEKKIPCPPVQVVQHTNYDTAFVIRENTAKTAALSNQLAIITSKQKDAENGRRKWRQWALITWAIIAVGGSGYLFAKFKIFI